MSRKGQFQSNLHPPVSYLFSRLRHHSGDSNNYLMPSHRHQSSLEAILDFWEPFSLTPQQAILARRLLDILVEDYGLEREIEKRYKPAKLIYTMLELVLSKDSFLTLFFTFLHEHLTSGPSNITLALSYFEDIGTWEPAARNDVASALEEFAHYMITQFFLPCVFNLHPPPCDAFLTQAL